MYDRLHTRMIRDYGGIVNVMPWFATFFVLFAMANCGLPGTSGFVGEFMVILAAFQDNFWIALLAAFTLIIGAAYTLWLVKRVIFGKIENPHVAKMQDLECARMDRARRVRRRRARARHLSETAGDADGRRGAADRAEPDAGQGLSDDMIEFHAYDLATMLPELFLLGATCAILLIDLFLKSSQRDTTHWLSIFALAVTGVLVWRNKVPDGVSLSAFNDMFVLRRDGDDPEGLHPAGHDCGVSLRAHLSARPQAVTSASSIC